MRFETRLRRQCTACTESSIKTYVANIKALAKLAGLQEIPGNDASWLDADLLQIVKNETLGRYKRFAIAGRKALQSYGSRTAGFSQDMSEQWAQAVVESSVEYDKQRNEQKRTARGEQLAERRLPSAPAPREAAVRGGSAIYLREHGARAHYAGRPLQDSDTFYHPFLRMARFARTLQRRASCQRGKTTFTSRQVAGTCTLANTKRFGPTEPSILHLQNR